jgi:hypothetical protein
MDRSSPYAATLLLDELLAEEALEAVGLPAPEDPATAAPAAS